MHYAVIVIVRPEGDDQDAIDAAVHDALLPSFEREWDWHQIGGRWTGHFDGYDPEADPENTKPCWLCDGSGKRKDMHVANGCNGCQGTGERLEWPTNWKRHPGDVIPVADLTLEHLKVYAVVAWGRWFGGERWIPWYADGERFERNERPPLDWIKEEFSDHLAVIVDCHN